MTNNSSQDDNKQEETQTQLVYIPQSISLAVGLWYIYRIVKGWLVFNDGKEPI